MAQGNRHHPRNPEGKDGPQVSPKAGPEGLFVLFGQAEEDGEDHLNFDQTAEEAEDNKEQDWDSVPMNAAAAGA